MIDQIINEHEATKQKGKLTTQQIESQSKLIDHLKGLNEVINSSTAKGQGAAPANSKQAAVPRQKAAGGGKKGAQASKQPSVQERSQGAGVPAKANNPPIDSAEDQFYLDDLLIEE